jgi:hypothetical protein
MGDRQYAIEGVEAALERAFPEAYRTATQRTLANDIDAILKLSKLTAAEIRLVERLVATLKRVLDERDISK